MGAQGREGRRPLPPPLRDEVGEEGWERGLLHGPEVEEEEEMRGKRVRN